MKRNTHIRIPPTPTLAANAACGSGAAVPVAVLGGTPPVEPSMIEATDHSPRILHVGNTTADRRHLVQTPPAEEKELQKQEEEGEEETPSTPVNIDVSKNVTPSVTTAPNEKEDEEDVANNRDKKLMNNREVDATVTERVGNGGNVPGGDDIPILSAEAIFLKSLEAPAGMLFPVLLSHSAIGPMLDTKDDDDLTAEKALPLSSFCGGISLFDALCQLFASCDDFLNGLSPGPTSPRHDEVEAVVTFATTLRLSISAILFHYYPQQHQQHQDEDEGGSPSFAAAVFQGRGLPFIFSSSSASFLSATTTAHQRALSIPILSAGDLVRHVSKGSRGVVRYCGPMYACTATAGPVTTSSSAFAASGRNTTTAAAATAVQRVVDVAAAYVIKRLLLPAWSHILSDLPAPPARHLRREEGSLPGKQEEQQEPSAAWWMQCLRGASIFGENRGGGAASATSAPPDLTPSSLKDVAASYLSALGECESAAAVVVDIVSATLLLAGRHLIHTLNHHQNHSPVPLNPNPSSSSSSPLPPVDEEPTTSTRAAPAGASAVPSTWLCLPPLPTTIQDDCPQDRRREDESEPLSSWRSRLRLDQTAHSLLSAVDASLTASVAQFPARFFGIHWELPIGRGDGAVHGVDFFSLAAVAAAGDEKDTAAATGCPAGHAGFVKRSQLRKSKNLCKALFLRYTYATTSTPEGLLGELLWKGKGRSTAKRQTTSKKTEEQPLTLSRSPPKHGGGCESSSSNHSPQQQHHMAVIGGAGAAPSGRLLFWPRRNVKEGDTTAQATSATGNGDTQGVIQGPVSANSSPCKEGHHHKHQHNNVHHQFHHHTHQRTRTTGRDPFYREPVVIGTTSVAMNDINEDVATAAAVSGGDAAAAGHHIISSMQALAQDVSGYGALVNVLGCDCAANASMQSVGSGPWHLASIDDDGDDEYLQEGDEDDSHQRHNAVEDENDEMVEDSTAVNKDDVLSPPARLGHYLDADTLVPADSPATLLFPSCRVVRSAPTKRACGAATNSRTESGVATGAGLALLVGAEAAGVGGGDGTEDGYNTTTNIREHAFPVVCFAATGPPPPPRTAPASHHHQHAAATATRTTGSARRPPPAITLSLQMLFPSLTVLSMPSSLLHSWSALVFGILQPLTSLTSLNVSGNTLCNDIPLAEMVRVCFENNTASSHWQNQNEASTPSAKHSPGKSSTNDIKSSNIGSVLQPYLLPRLISLNISESTTSSETLLFLLATFSASLTELNAGFLKAPSQMGHYYRNVLMNMNANGTGRGNGDTERRNKMTTPADIATSLLDACIDHYAAPLHPYRIALAISRYQQTEENASSTPPTAQTAPSSLSSVCSPPPPPPLSPLETFFVCAAQSLLQKLQKLTVDGTDFSVPMSLQDAYHRHRTRGTENKEKDKYAAKTDLSSLLRGSSSSTVNTVPMTEPSVGALFSSILCVATAADKALHQWRRRLLPPTPPHCRSVTTGSSNPHAILAPRLHYYHHNTPTKKSAMQEQHASAQQQQDANRIAAIPPNLPQGVALPSPMPSFAIGALAARPPLPLTSSSFTTISLSSTTAAAAPATASSSLSVSGALQAKPSLRCVSVSSCPTLVSLAYPTATPVNRCSAKKKAAAVCEQQEEECDEEEQFERHFFLEDTRARLDAELDVLRRASSEVSVVSDADIADPDAKSLYHLCYFFRSVGVRVFDHVTLLQARGTAIDNWDRGLLDLHDRRCPSSSSSSSTHPSTKHQQEEDALVQTKPCFPRLQEILFSDCPALGSHKSTTSDANTTTTGAPEHDIFTVNNIMNDISTQRRLLVGLLPPRIVKLNKSDVTRSEISSAERFLQQRLGYAAPYAERVVRPLQVTFSKSWIMQTAKRLTTVTGTKKNHIKLLVHSCNENDDSDAAEEQRLSFLLELLRVLLQIRPVEQHSHHGADATMSEMTAASSLVAAPTMADYLVDVFGIGLVPGPFLPLPPHASTSNTTSPTITAAATTPKATDERQTPAKNIKGVATLYVHHPHHKPRHGQHNHYFDLASSTVLAAEHEGHAIDLRPGGGQNPHRPPTPPPSLQQPSAEDAKEGEEEKDMLQDEAALYDEMKTIRQPSDDDVDEDAVDRGGNEADQQEEETEAAGPHSPSKDLLPTTSTARSPPKTQPSPTCSSTPHASQTTQPQQPQQQIIFPLVAAPRLRKALIESVVVEAAKAHADLVFAAAQLCVLYSPFVASCAAYVRGRMAEGPPQPLLNRDDEDPQSQATLDVAVTDIIALGQQQQQQFSSHDHHQALSSLSSLVDSTIVEASAKLAHDIAKYVRLFAYCNETDGVQAVLLEQLQQEQQVTPAKASSAAAAVATTSLTNAQTPFPVIAGTFTKVFVRHTEQHCGLFAEVANADILRSSVEPCGVSAIGTDAEDGAGENCMKVHTEEDCGKRKAGETEQDGNAGGRDDQSVTESISTGLGDSLRTPLLVPSVTANTTRGGAANQQNPASGAGGGDPLLVCGARNPNAFITAQLQRHGRLLPVASSTASLTNLGGGPTHGRTSSGNYRNQGIPGTPATPLSLSVLSPSPNNAGGGGFSSGVFSPYGSMSGPGFGAAAVAPAEGAVDDDDFDHFNDDHDVEDDPRHWLATAAAVTSDDLTAAAVAMAVAVTSTETADTTGAVVALPPAIPPLLSDPFSGVDTGATATGAQTYADPTTTSDTTAAIPSTSALLCPPSLLKVTQTSTVTGRRSGGPLTAPAAPHLSVPPALIAAARSAKRNVGFSTTTTTTSTTTTTTSCTNTTTNDEDGCATVGEATCAVHVSHVTTASGEPLFGNDSDQQEREHHQDERVLLQRSLEMTTMCERQHLHQYHKSQTLRRPNPPQVAPTPTSLTVSGQSKLQAAASAAAATSSISTATKKVVPLNAAAAVSVSPLASAVLKQQLLDVLEGYPYYMRYDGFVGGDQPGEVVENTVSTTTNNDNNNSSSDNNKTLSTTTKSTSKSASTTTLTATGTSTSDHNRSLLHLSTSASATTAAPTTAASNNMTEALRAVIEKKKADFGKGSSSNTNNANKSSSTTTTASRPRLVDNHVRVEYTVVALSASDLLAERCGCFHDILRDHIRMARTRRRAQKQKEREKRDGGRIHTISSHQHHHHSRSGGGGGDTESVASSSMTNATTTTATTATTNLLGSVAGLGPGGHPQHPLGTGAGAEATEDAVPLNYSAEHPADPMFEVDIDARWAVRDLWRALSAAAHLDFNGTPYDAYRALYEAGDDDKTPWDDSTDIAAPPAAAAAATAAAETAANNKAQTASPNEQTNPTGSTTNKKKKRGEKPRPAPLHHLHAIHDEEEHWSLCSLTMDTTLGRAIKKLGENFQQEQSQQQKSKEKSNSGSGSGSGGEHLLTRSCRDMLREFAVPSPSTAAPQPPPHHERNQHHIHSNNPAGYRFPPLEAVFPSGASFFFHIDRELSENEGALARGVHCKNLFRGQDPLHRFHMCSGDIIVIVRVI